MNFLRVILIVAVGCVLFILAAPTVHEDLLRRQVEEQYTRILMPLTMADDRTPPGELVIFRLRTGNRRDDLWAAWVALGYGWHVKRLDRDGVVLEKAKEN